jgi:hypothetical protein
MLTGPLLAGCEGNQVYSSARIGVRMGADGGVEIVSYACGRAVPGKVEVTDRKGLKRLWSATSVSALDGLVVVPADGGPALGWVIEGSVDAGSTQQLDARVYLGDKVGWQSTYFVPDDLARDQLVVASWSFAGKDRVSENEFVAVNQEWCARGR